MSARTVLSAAICAAAVAAGAAAYVAIGSPAVAQSAPTKVHRLAFHVDSSDPAVQQLVLNNVENVSDHYKQKGEKVQIEVVAYGPGLHMLRADTSKVKQRIAAMSLEIDNLAFDACGNTRSKMSKAENKTIPIVSEARMVASGVVRLLELQEAGWSYIRP